MKGKNKGSAVVEACVVIPLFLFFMLFIIYLYRMIYVEAHIHQSLCEAAVYCAKRCYLEDRMLHGSQEEAGLSSAEIGVATGIIYVQFNKYMGNDTMVKNVIAGGQNGIIITVKADETDRKVFVAKASYMTEIDVPILGSFKFPRSNEVKQKAFLGCGSEDRVDEDESYVYVTPNESVYHISRGCSHLNRSVRAVSGHGDYEPCKFCGREESEGRVYVTDNGEVYHCNPKCMGLKRTVMRVKKKTVNGLRVCSRCGR